MAWTRRTWLGLSAVAACLAALCFVHDGLSRSESELRQRQTELADVRHDVDRGRFLQKRLPELKRKIQRIESELGEVDLLIPSNNPASSLRQLEHLDAANDRRLMKPRSPEYLHWRQRERERLEADILAGERDEIEWLRSALQLFRFEPLSITLSKKALVGRNELSFEVEARSSFSELALALGRLTSLSGTTTVESMRVRRDPGSPEHEDLALVSLSLVAHRSPEGCPKTWESEPRPGEEREFDTWRDGQGMPTVTAHYEAGKLHGLRTEWYPGGMPADAVHYEHGQRHGERMYWRPDGSLQYRMQFEDGELHGVHETYRPDGSLHWKRWFDDSLHGDGYLGWHESGCLSHARIGGAFPLEVALSESGEVLAHVSKEPGGSLVTHYGEGGAKLREYRRAERFEPRGTWSWWSPSGVLLRQAEFSDEGRLERVREWSESGELTLDCEGCLYAWQEDHIDGSSSRGTYQNGMREGHWTEWSSEGRLYRRVEYRQGLQHGTLTSWSNDGGLISVRSYREGREEGPQFRYSVTGELEEESFIYQALPLEDADELPWSFPASHLFEPSPLF